MYAFLDGGVRTGWPRGKSNVKADLGASVQVGALLLTSLRQEIEIASIGE